jgi:hypothetical protein
VRHISNMELGRNFFDELMMLEEWLTPKVNKCRLVIDIYSVVKLRSRVKLSSYGQKKDKPVLMDVLFPFLSFRLRSGSASGKSWPPSARSALTSRT